MKVRCMSWRHKVTALALTTLLAAAPVSAQRRRAVSPPSNPEVIPFTTVVPLTGDPVTITAAKDGNVVRCLETRCVVDAIKQNQTLVYENLPADQMYAIQAPEGSEVRSGIEPFPISSFGQNHVLPTYDPNVYSMRVGIVALTQGAVDVRFLAENGVQRDVKSVPLKRGVNFFDPTQFSLSGNQQLELNAPAFIELTNKTTGKKTYLPAKQLSSAVGEQYFPFATANTTGTFKNVDATGVRGISAFFLPPQDNPNLTVVTGLFANNYGIETRPDIAKGKGAVLVRGDVIAGSYSPVIAWGMVDGDGMSATSQYARARSGQLGDTTITTDLSFAGLPSGATLYLVSRDIGNGIVKVTDVNGNPVKDIPFSLMTNEAKSVTLSDLPQGTYRALVQLNESTNDYRPQVAGVAGVPSSNGIDYREGLAVVRPTSRVSGEEYVAKWFDPIKSNIVYLDGREGYCMINGNCGTKSYAPELAAALFPTSNYPGTAKDFENFIRGLADGNPSNGELYKQKDPVKISGQSTAKYQVFALDPNDQVINVDMNSSNLSAVQSVYRSFLIDMTNAHPEDYGGSAASGLNAVLAPGWDTRHNNDANGRRLSE
jgi:hypothetical protein